MTTGMNQAKRCAALFAASALLCLLPVLVSGDENTPSHPLMIYGSSKGIVGHNGPADAQSVHPGTPMVLDPITGSLQFNLGGSETRKLQLRLSRPLMVDTGQYLLSPVTDSAALGLGAALQVPLAGGLSIHGGVEQLKGRTQFQTLASIQCLNGTLGPNFYTASGCHFVNETGPTFDRRTLNLGTSHTFGNLTTSIDWFNTTAESGTTDVYKLNQVDPSALLENRLLTPFAGDGLSTGGLAAAPLNSETTGIDLNFQLGIATDQAGDVRLGLALTRVLDANYQGIYGHGLGPLDWDIARPFDAASLGIEWSRGSFSSGIRGYYREPVSFLNHENLDSMSTFDVHFTWRAPWNANLSVGASNVLGAGVEKGSNIDKTGDRFESIYGRIPYVRYQQDL